MVLQAHLYNGSGQPVTLKAIKDTSISVTMLNHQNISSSLSFNDIQWDHKNEYILEIPVQTYLNNVSIEIECKVDKYEGKPQEIKLSKSILFLTQMENYTNNHLFLTRDGDNYRLQAVGVNG